LTLQKLELIRVVPYPIHKELPIWEGIKGQEKEKTKEEIKEKNKEAHTLAFP
jgi:hypothetical protein